MSDARVTAADLLLAGWHRVSDAFGVKWILPFVVTVPMRFADAVRLYRMGARNDR